LLYEKMKNIHFKITVYAINNNIFLILFCLSKIWLFYILFSVMFNMQITRNCAGPHKPCCLTSFFWTDTANYVFRIFFIDIPGNFLFFLQSSYWKSLIFKVFSLFVQNSIRFMHFLIKFGKNSFKILLNFFKDIITCLYPFYIFSIKTNFSNHATFFKFH